MNSIYIPNIPVSFSEQMVADTFKTFQIGLVERVDFLPPHEHNARIRKAFVHFTPYNSERMCAVAQHHAHNESYRLTIDGQGHFWDLCENKRPIPTSTLNIHQLTENIRIMQANFESKIADLTAQVAAIPLMQAEIADLRSRITYLEDPEWLTSTGTGFQTDPLTISMLNDDAMDDCISENGSEDYDVAAVHPCDEQAYEAAMVSSREDEDEDEEYDYEYDATSDAGNLTPIRMACDDDVPASSAEFRAEIENHFVHQRGVAAAKAPSLMRTQSLHNYDGGSQCGSEMNWCDEIAMVSCGDSDDDDDAAADEKSFVQEFMMECV